jgi:phage replication O-like protein O
MKKSDFYFTKFPNVLLDDVMPMIGPSSFKVLSIIIRKSRGFQKKGDMISISQFEEQAGLSRNTVLDSIKELVDKKIVNKQKKQNSFWYSINESYLEILLKTGSSNSEKKGSDSELFKVHYPNFEAVQNVNTLKKDLNKNEINTTTTSFSEEEYLKICTYWNERFGGTLKPENQKIKKQIIEALARFSVNQLQKAMFYRSKADYYRKKVPYLRNKPASFFGYPETIMNDLQRKPKNLFTYDEMIDKVVNHQGLTTDDFQMIDSFQENDEKLWEFKKQKKKA